MVTEEIKLVDIQDPELIASIQKFLNVKEATVGPLTLRSFGQWKQKNYLNNLDTIGPSSYKLLKNQYTGLSSDLSSSPSPSPYKVELIIEFEGFHDTAYADPLLGWRVPTIGYGTTVYNTGIKVKQGDTITKEEAIDQLLHYVNKRIIPKLSKIPYWNQMNINQQSALISFAYNLGENFYRKNGFNSISNILARKEWSKVPEILKLYRNPGSNVEQGLLRRRIAEGKLFATPV